MDTSNAARHIESSRLKCRSFAASLNKVLSKGAWSVPDLETDPGDVFDILNQGIGSGEFGVLESPCSSW